MEPSIPSRTRRPSGVAVVSRRTSRLSTGKAAGVFSLRDRRSARRPGPAGTNRWNRGQSMMVVVALMSALLLLPAALTALTIAELGNSSQSVATDNSVAAAEAGLNNYISLIESNVGFDSKKAGTSTYAAFGGTGGAVSWEPVNGAPNECYFYETGPVTSTTVDVTVTGRAGPADNTTGLCSTNSAAHYKYKTITSTLVYQSPGVDPYSYLNEYNAANPFVYGGYSGGLNYCGYYAYATNPNWSFMFLGLGVSYGLSADVDFDGQDTVGGYPINSDYDNGSLLDWVLGLPAPDDTHNQATWGFIASPGSVGGALGPSQGGTIFASSGQFTWGAEGLILAWPGISTDWPGVYPYGAPYGEDNSIWNNAQSPPLPSLWTTGQYGAPYSNGAGGNPGTDTTGDVNGNGGPNGCQFFGTPFHDGFYTSSYIFDGNPGSLNPSGNGKIYSNDEYYLCPAYSNGASAQFNNVSVLSGDPYPPGTPATPGGELNPSVVNWTVFGFTIFSLSANVNWQAGPPYWVTGNTGSFTTTFFGTSYGNNDIQVCGNAPNPAPSITQATGPNKVYLPYTNPADYTLAATLAKAAGDCIYDGGGTGSITITFTGGTGASVSLGGGAVLSSGPPSCVGLNATPGPPGIFFVKNGDAYVSGTVGSGQNYTVAVAGTSPSEVSLPASSQAFPNQVVNSGGTTTLTSSTGPKQGFNALTDSYPDSIYITGDITYGGCTPPFTTANCSDYLGLISQNNVVISYPTKTPNGEGTPDTDGSWVNDDGNPNPSGPASDRYENGGTGGGAVNQTENSYGASTWCCGDSQPPQGEDINGGALNDNDSAGPGSSDWGNDSAMDSSGPGRQGDENDGSCCDNDGDFRWQEDGGDTAGITWANCPGGDAGEPSSCTWGGEPGSCNDNCSWGGTDSDQYSWPSDPTDGDGYYSSDGWLGAADGWDSDDSFCCEASFPGQDNDANWNNADNDRTWNHYDADESYSTDGCLNDISDCVSDFDSDNDGSLATDKDAHWNNNENDIQHPSNNDGDACYTTDSFTSGCDGMTYWGVDGCDSDDINVCITEAYGNGLNGDPDATWLNSNDGDSYDNENDASYINQTCTVGGAAIDPDGDGHCQGDANSDGAGDADDTGGATSATEMGDTGPFVHTIDADIEAVWGSFMLDKYGYFSNADHSCEVSTFYAGIINFTNEPSDDGSNNVCTSDGDNDENSLGNLTVNGAVAEFWRGILNHFEAYAWGNMISGGYGNTLPPADPNSKKITFNYDGRFQKFIPAGMPGVGNPTWSPSTQSFETPVCPTGNVLASNDEVVTACPS